MAPNELGQCPGLKTYQSAYPKLSRALVLIMEGEGDLPLNTIGSLAAFVVFSSSSGLISEHEDHGAASRGLAEALNDGHDDAVIYRREKDWVVH